MRLNVLATVAVLTTTPGGLPGPSARQAAPDVTAQRTTAETLQTCVPVFTPIPTNRALPHAYVDQGLASLPHLYPMHALLAQRRYSQAGQTEYSLLVYKKDAAIGQVTIEGVAVHEPRAWRFSATCAADDAIEGVLTTLERVAALERSAP